MSGFTTSIPYLTRSNLWSTELKEVLEDELYAQRYIDWITDFPDGDTLNIPSVGQMEVQDYAENQPIRYTAMDTGNFTFTITDYKSSGTYVTKKMLQDSYVMDKVKQTFVPRMKRALMKVIEQDVLAVGPAGQTSANENAINNARHRMIGSGANETLAVEDFAYALYALQKANVPTTNLCAIVDPSCEVAMNKITNLVNFSNNPRWEGIVSSGISTGMKFIKNIYGFDVYTSQNLKVNTASEAINGVTAAAGVNNLFFSATPDVLPFVGSMRQAPEVQSEFNKDFQREEHVVTCRYGFKLYRPENLVCVVTDTDQVYA